MAAAEAATAANKPLTQPRWPRWQPRKQNKAADAESYGAASSAVTRAKAHATAADDGSGCGGRRDDCGCGGSGQR